VEDKTVDQIKRLTKALKEEKAKSDKATAENTRMSNLLCDMDDKLQLKDGAISSLRKQLDDMVNNPPAPVEVVKEVIPEDYESLKVKVLNAEAAIREAQEAAADAEERLAAMTADTDDEQDHEQRSDDTFQLETLMSICNDVHAKLWYAPFFDFSIVSADKRRSYRIGINGILSLCQRITQAIDMADGVIVDEGGVVE